ncbi:Sec63 Brl domain containing protein, putative [Angomonas deanei]|uniref:Sec63 Brl domain containing protein, putative n=1 Tax=Angomonas deanei TaxID=59799 RepID=A0A7G2CJH8_9TRYP|nr:Sec63 Brl domain containing protein, putative [Angomonas deanei]
MPVPISEQEADSPNAKTYLLLQAHLSRATLPITDYYTDQKSVIDNSVRIIQSMVDVTANNGHLFAALRAMTLLQCVVQARWWNCASTLMQLPHVTEEMLPEIDRQCHVKEAAELANAPLDTLFQFQRVLEQKEFQLEPWQVQEAMEGVRGLPLLDMRVAVTQRPKEDAEDEEEETSYDITVDVERLSYPQKHAVAPHFGKTKDEQYWLVVGHEPTGELVAMKRINRISRHTTLSLIVDWDEEWETTAEGVELNVYLVCDAYLGMDQQNTFVLPKPVEAV